MTLWIYYETDGDSGWYRVKLFHTKISADNYRKFADSAYGKVEQIDVQDPLPFEEREDNGFRTQSL